MELKTKEEVINQVETYLNKTSNHLFVTDSGHLYKVMPLNRDGKLYIVTLIMGKNTVTLTITEAVPDWLYNNYGNATANVIKHNLFPEYQKTKSIPYFKKMRVLVNEMMLEIKTDNQKNKELVDKLKSKLPEFEVVK